MTHAGNNLGDSVKEATELIAAISGPRGKLGGDQDRSAPVDWVLPQPAIEIRPGEYSRAI